MILSFLGHNWEWWLTQGAPGLGAIATFILVLYYARLFGQTREQTRATKAGYAPSLDTRLEYDDDDILLTVVNRGEGVAKNIKFGIETTVDGETCGYIADFQTTLRPEHALTWNSDGPVVRLRPVVHNPKTENYDQTLLSDLIEEADSAYFKISIAYSDIIEERDYSQTLVSMSTTLEDRDTLEDVLRRSQHRYRPWLTGPEKITLLRPKHISLKERWKFVKDRYRERIDEVLPNIRRNENSVGQLYIGLAFKDRIEAETVVYEPDTDDELPRFAS